MAGSNNFLQHNPSQANQETDSNYLSDSLRTGGIGTDAILPSLWLNKLYYQVSTFVAAFGTMMANKGYVMSDANIGTLEGVLANIITNADTKPPLVQVPFSGAVTFDCSIANGFDITLSGNVTSSNLANMQIGQIVTIVIHQDGVGGRTFNPPPQIVSGEFLPIEIGIQQCTIQSFIKTEDGSIRNLDTYDVYQQSEINTINGQITALQTGKQNNLGFTPVQQGTGVGQLGNVVKIGWNGSRVKVTIDVTDEGNIVFDAQLAPLQTQVNNLSGTVSGIQSQVTTLQGTVNPMPGQISTLQSQVSGLQSTVNPIPGQISSLQSQINGINGTLSPIPGEVSSLQGSVNNINAFIGRFLAGISGNGTLEIPTNAGTVWIQWGITQDFGGGQGFVGFANAFPNACFGVSLTTLSNTDRICYVVNGSVGRTGFTGGNNGSNGFAFYIAIGY